MSIYDPDAADLSAWGALVEKQSKGLKPDEFTWHTPEGIPLKTLYTAEDLESLPYTNTMPGIAPYIRGAWASERGILKFRANPNPDIP